MRPRTFTPIQPATGGKVHATILSTPLRTNCGAPCDGWRVVDAPLECEKCKDSMRRRGR